MSRRPEGFHTITPELVLKGAAAAIADYKAVFGAVEFTRILAPGSDKIFHASIGFGDSKVFIRDETPGDSAGAVKARFYLYVDDVDSQHKKATAAGMKEIAAPEDMSWGDRVSTVTDRYGQMWSLAMRISPDSKSRKASSI